jgi:hypothetical protein
MDMFAMIRTTYHSVLRDWYHIAAACVAVPAHETSWAGSANPSSRSAPLSSSFPSLARRRVEKIQWAVLRLVVGACARACAAGVVERLSSAQSALLRKLTVRRILGSWTSRSQKSAVAKLNGRNELGSRESVVCATSSSLLTAPSSPGRDWWMRCSSRMEEVVSFGSERARWCGGGFGLALQRLVSAGDSWEGAKRGE